MDMSSQKENIEYLKGQTLLEGLTDDELRKISKFFKKKEFLTNDVIIDEEDETTELYLILEGEVSIWKLDEEGLFNLPLGKLQPGNIFGEMSFMDGSPRSSTIEASNKTTLLELSREDLNKAREELSDIANKIISNIAIININRLRASNATHVKTLRTSLKKFQSRQKSGIFAIYFMLIAAFLTFLYVIFNPHLAFFGKAIENWSYWTLLLSTTFILIKSFHFYLDELGVTLNSLKKSFFETLPILAVGIPAIYMGSLFITKTTNVQSQPNWPLYILLYLFYCIAFEFIVRGVFQLSIQKFFEDEIGWKSIFLAACFASFIPFDAYLYTGLSAFIFFYFLFNLGLGWIFFHQKNLLGVILIHFFIGGLANFLFF